MRVILLALTNNKEELKLYRYCSRNFNDYLKNFSFIDLEIETIILVLEKLQLFFFQEQFILRIDCEKILRNSLKTNFFQNYPQKDR